MEKKLALVDGRREVGPHIPSTGADDAPEVEIVTPQPARIVFTLSVPTGWTLLAILVGAGVACAWTETFRALGVGLLAASTVLSGPFLYMLYRSSRPLPPVASDSDRQRERLIQMLSRGVFVEPDEAGNRVREALVNEQIVLADLACIIEVAAARHTNTVSMRRNGALLIADDERRVSRFLSVATNYQVTSRAALNDAIAA